MGFGGAFAQRGHERIEEALERCFMKPIHVGLGAKSPVPVGRNPRARVSS